MILGLFQIYPLSARNLNPTTKQIDIDIYYDHGGRVDIRGMKINIDIIIERMKIKDPEAVSFDGNLSKEKLPYIMKLALKLAHYCRFYNHSCPCNKKSEHSYKKKKVANDLSFLQYYQTLFNIKYPGEVGQPQNEQDGHLGQI